MMLFVMHVMNVIIVSIMNMIGFDIIGGSLMMMMTFRPM